MSLTVTFICSTTFYSRFSKEKHMLDLILDETTCNR